MRNSSQGTIPGATRIANRNPLRGGREGGHRGGSAHNCGTQPTSRRVMAREFRKGLKKSAIIASPAEEYWVDRDRTWPLTGPQDLGSIPDTGPGPDTHPVPDFGSGGDFRYGKSQVHPATPNFSADYQMQERAATPPSRKASARDSRTASGGQHSERPAGSKYGAESEYPEGYNFWNAEFQGTTG